jgi:hypothetical protein
MRPFNFNKKPQRTSEEFRTALREAGFGVEQGRIVDVSGRCRSRAERARHPDSARCRSMAGSNGPRVAGAVAGDMPEALSLILRAD